MSMRLPTFASCLLLSVFRLKVIKLINLNVDIVQLLFFLPILYISAVIFNTHCVFTDICY